MKLPKQTNRYCPHCRKHTMHKISLSKTKSPGSARPLGRFSKGRRKFGKGIGNLGKFGSKPPLGSWKMTGKKSTKKMDKRYECTVCKKKHIEGTGIRAKKVEFV